MKVNVLLFDDFDMLEAMGPAQVFSLLPQHFFVEYYSFPGMLVKSLQGGKVWTENMKPDLSGDILIIPGGKGARRLVRYEEGIHKYLKMIINNHSFCLMIGSGSAAVAQTGLLFRRRICNYLMDENWNHMFTVGVYREKEIRWAADGKYYSAISAVDGIDMSLSVLADILDLDIAARVATELGYVWNPDCEEGISR